MEHLGPFIMPLVIAGVAVGAWVYNESVKRRFFEAFSGDRQLDVDVNESGKPVLTTRPPLRGLKLVAVGGGKNNPRRWEAQSALARVARRTTLHVTREGIVGAIRERLGMSDVHVGNPTFDTYVCLRGSDVDVVRGLFSSDAVQAATIALFREGGTTSVDIDEAGGLAIVSTRGVLDPLEARARIRLALAFIDALAAVSAAPALPAPDGSDVVSGAVGGTSGAPVGVSASGSERRKA